MEQTFIEKIFTNYDHLKGKYLGCFCKDQMEQLSKKIETNLKQDIVNMRTFALINTGSISSSREHWMGLIINRTTDCCGFFNSFGQNSKWLNDTLLNLFKEVHKTNYIVQTESAQTCGLYMIYFIVCMMNPKDTMNTTRTINVGQYIRRHYDTKSNDTHLKDEHIIRHLSKKFKTNFNMLLPK